MTRETLIKSHMRDRSTFVPCVVTECSNGLPRSAQKHSGPSDEAQIYRVAPSAAYAALRALQRYLPWLQRDALHPSALGTTHVARLNQCFPKIIAGLALLLPIVAYAGFDEGVEAYAQAEYEKAMAEFKPLAEQGEARSQYFMGFLYRYGYGVKADATEAGRWFRLAGEQGDAKSLYYLGKMYEGGEGVERDPVAAHMYFDLAAKNSPNPRDAAYTREDIKKLERKMSPEQIAKAKEMAGQWKPSSK